MRKTYLLYTLICIIAVLLTSARAEEGDKQASLQAKTTAGAEKQEREERKRDERKERVKRERDEDRDKDDDDDDDDREEQHASAVILITSNPRTFEIDPDAIRYLLTETDWLGEEELEIDFEPLPCGREGSVIGVLHVEVEGTEKIDPKLLEKISDRLQAVLTTLAKATSMEPFKEEFNSARRRAAETKEQVEVLSRQTQEIRNHLLHEGIVPDEMGQHIAMLQRERFQMQVELAGLRARHETLMPRIAQSAKKMDKAKAAAQMGLKRMQAAIEVHTAHLKRLQEANKRVAGSVPKSDIEQAAAELLLAKAELEERRHEINREYEGGMLQLLNERAIETEVERKSIEARLEMINKRIAQFQNKELLKLAGTFRQISRQLEAAEHRREAAGDELAELESQQSRMRLPRVKILRPAELLKQKK